MFDQPFLICCLHFPQTVLALEGFLLLLCIMNTAVTPNSRKIRKIRPLKEKYGQKYGKKIRCLTFLTFFIVFCMFVRSWRPGTRLKSFLESIRFNSTVYEPVATLKTSNRLIFYVFRPPFRSADSSIPTFFVAKRFFDEGSDPVRPIPQDPHRNSAQNDVLASSPFFFDFQWWLERTELRATEG